MTRPINVMAFTQWLEQAPRENLPVFFIYGSEPALIFLTQQCLQRYARSQDIAHTIIHVDQHFAWQTLSASMQQESLFSTERYIDIRIHNKLNKETYSSLLACMQAQHPQRILSVSCDQITWQDKKDKRFQQLLMHCAPLVCDTPAETVLKTWIRAHPPFSANTPEAWVDTFLKLCHGEFSNIAQELNKLALLFPEGLPSEDVLHTHIVTYRHDILLDDVTPCVLGLDTPCAPLLFTHLKEHGTPTQLVLWRVAEDIRQWLRCHAYIHMPMSRYSAYQKAKLFGKRQQWYQQALEKASAEAMQKALLYCLEIDRMIKGVPAEGGLTDPWQGFLHLCYITASRTT